MLDQIQQYFLSNSQNYLQCVREHLSLSLTALAIAGMIALPAGYACSLFRPMEKLTTLVAQALRVVPSLAVLFILIPLIGVGKLPALIALVMLGVPPIMINTTIGFKEVPFTIAETATGLGMNKWQLFRKIQLPLAVPYILSGIKLALVEIIASATLATYIGAGGLGTLIFTGLGLYRIDLLLIGGVSVAGLSLLTTLLLDLMIKRSSGKI